MYQIYISLYDPIPTIDNVFVNVVSLTHLSEYFSEYAETIPGQTTEFLSSVAKKNQVWLVGGSMPEKDGNKIYNTSTVYNPNGEIIAKHRKVGYLICIQYIFFIDLPINSFQYFLSCTFSSLINEVLRIDMNYFF